MPGLNLLFNRFLRFLKLWFEFLQGYWEEHLFIISPSLLAFRRLLSARRVGRVELLLKNVDYLRVIVIGVSWCFDLLSFFKITRLVTLLLGFLFVLRVKIR